MATPIIDVTAGMSWNSGTSTTRSYTHTAGAGVTPGLGIACSFIRANGGQTISGATWNGSAMTAAAAGFVGLNNGYMRIFYINNPANGTVEFTYSASPPRGTIIGVTLYNTDATTPISNVTGGGSANDTAPTRTVTSAANKLVMAFTGCEADDITFDFNTATVLSPSQVAQAGAGADTGYRLYGTTKGGAASVVMNATLSAARQWLEQGFTITDGTNGSAGGGSIAAISSGYHQRGLR